MENGTKRILSNSRLEISSDLNRLVMQKILQQERKKMMRRIFICCFLGLSTLSLAAFLLIRNMQVSSTSAFLGTGVTQLGHTIAKNQTIIIPFLILLIVQRLISGRSKPGFS